MVIRHVFLKTGRDLTAMSGDAWAVVLTLVLGFTAGILSGMFGIGGGLVIVPALVILFGLPMKTATGTSLFALIWPVGLLGVIEYYRVGHMDIRRGALIAIGLFLGAYFGARITLSVSPAVMKRGYAVFLLVVGTYFLLATKSPPARDQPAAAHEPATSPAPPASPEVRDQVH
jgi:uncharacterized membrane protein YfcA